MVGTLWSDSIFAPDPLLGLYLHDFSLIALTFEMLIQYNRLSSNILSHSAGVA